MLLRFGLLNTLASFLYSVSGDDDDGICTVVVRNSAQVVGHAAMLLCFVFHFLSWRVVLPSFFFPTAFFFFLLLFLSFFIPFFFLFSIFFFCK